MYLPPARHTCSCSVLAIDRLELLQQGENLREISMCLDIDGNVLYGGTVHGRDSAHFEFSRNRNCLECGIPYTPRAV